MDQERKPRRSKVEQNERNGIETTSGSTEDKAGKDADCKRSVQETKSNAKLHELKTKWPVSHGNTTLSGNAVGKCDTKVPLELSKPKRHCVGNKPNARSTSVTRMVNTNEPDGEKLLFKDIEDGGKLPADSECGPSEDTHAKLNSNVPTVELDQTEKILKEFRCRVVLSELLLKEVVQSHRAKQAELEATTIRVQELTKKRDALRVQLEEVQKSRDLNAEQCAQKSQMILNKRQAVGNLKIKARILAKYNDH